MKVKDHIKTAMIACVLVGFVVHLFAFTNIIPNSDGISRIYEEQQMTISGRWFLNYASMFHGYIQAPALIGALTLIFTAIAAGMIVDILEIKDQVSAALCGAFLVVFPSVTYNNLYIFTASAYAIGAALAVFSVWYYRKYPKYFLVSALAAACAMGIYQAYLAFAAALALCCVIKDFLDDNADIIKSFWNAVKLLGVLILGIAQYFLILQIFLKVKNLTLWSYRGIDTMGLDGNLIDSLLNTYKEFIAYFVVPDSVNYITGFFTALHGLLIVLAAAALIQHLIDRRLYREPLRMVLLVISVGLIPMAFNAIRLLSEMSPNMKHSYVFVYILAVFLIGKVDRKAWRYALCGIGMMIVLVCAQIANIAYTSSATAHRATESYATNLVGRIESVSGYNHEMEVVIIGGFPKETYYNGVEAFKIVEHYSCMSSNVVPLNKHIYYYLNDWLNVPWQEPDEEIMIAVAESEEFKSMPLYPDDGSVKIIDGRVVVKIAESYTPKSEFEIQYENRR